MTNRPQYEVANVAQKPVGSRDYVSEGSTAPRRRQRISFRRSVWGLLGPVARIAFVGLIASALLAIGLAWFIPRQVERRFLTSMARADEELVSVLVSTSPGLPIDEADRQELDASIQRLIEENRLVRTKLWSIDGVILYSDESRLIGATFPPDEDFENIAGSAWHLSDLSADENEFERDLGYQRLLETYVPVMVDGEAVGVWEVYRSLEEFDRAIGSVRNSVWLAVGFGLTTLAVFLGAGFGALVIVADRRRTDAERRRDELETLLGLARNSWQSDDPASIATAAVEILVDDNRITCARLTHRHTDGGAWEVVAEAGDVRACELANGYEAGSEEMQSAPGRTVSVEVGAYGLEVCQPLSVEPLTPALLSAMLEEIAIGVDKARLLEELEENRAHIQLIMEKLVEAQEEERRVTVEQIHDGLAQDLYRVLFGIRGCLAADEAEAREELRRLEVLVADSSRQLRRLLQEIHPSVVDDVGLAASIESLADRMQDDYGLEVTTDFGPFREPGYHQRLALFRVTNEALVNAAKHSGSRVASVAVGERNGSIEIVVADEGHGIAAEASDGIGMWIMQERAASQGGAVTIATEESGTTVTVSMPIRETADAG